MTTNLSRNVGPAWLVIYDDDPAKDLSEKVTRAAEAYEKRHGRQPDTCRVHSSALGKARWRNVGDIRVVKSQYVLPHNMWLRRKV